MTLPDFSFLYPTFLVFARASGLLIFLPVLSGQMIPRQIKIALCGFLALAIAPVALADFTPPSHWLLGAVQIAHEITVGMIMGFVARLIIYALEVAGEFISMSIGLAMAAQVDPFTRNRSSPSNALLVALSTIVFLATDSHIWCLTAFARSYEVIAPDVPLNPAAPLEVANVSARLFLIALQICAPVLAVAFVVNLCFATLGRAAPTLNVFVLSFPVQILAGFVMLSLTMLLIAQYVINYYQNAPQMMLEYLR